MTRETSNSQIFCNNKTLVSPTRNIIHIVTIVPRQEIKLLSSSQFWLSLCSYKSPITPGEQLCLQLESMQNSSLWQLWNKNQTSKVQDCEMISCHRHLQCERLMKSTCTRAQTHTNKTTTKIINAAQSYQTSVQSVLQPPEIFRDYYGFLS